MTKHYVIDTNIILHNPYFLNKLENCGVTIPYSVLHELDSFKKDNELYRNVGIFANILDKLHETHYITDKGVSVTLYNQMPSELILGILGGITVDNIIVGTAYEYHKMGMDVEILSNDTIIRVKARGLGVGLKASKFTSYSNNDNSSMIYSGHDTVYIDGNIIDSIYKGGTISFDLIRYSYEKEIFPHMFLILKDLESSKSAIMKANVDKGLFELVNPNLMPLWGISARNAQQRMALQLLLDPDIHLVTISGKAGSGKTLLALAAGLVTAVDERIYDAGIMLTTPVVPMGKDIGYLPGDKEAKLQPYMQSYYDNLKELVGEKDNYLQLGIEIEALTYVRGRTLPNRFIVVDEAQNMTKHEAKTMITRAGMGAKIILMGDPEQIDAPYLDSINNGLTYTINKFKNESIAGHIALEKGERSPLADIASEIM